MEPIISLTDLISTVEIKSGATDGSHSIQCKSTKEISSIIILFYQIFISSLYPEH